MINCGISFKNGYSSRVECAGFWLLQEKVTDGLGIYIKKQKARQIWVSVLRYLEEDVVPFHFNWEWKQNMLIFILKNYGSAIDAFEGISKYTEKYNMRIPQESLEKRTLEEVYRTAS